MSSQVAPAGHAATLPDPAPPATRWSVCLYAHTHWDREWYQPFERFRMQLVPAVDRILDTLASDEAFTCYVLDGQTIVLDDYLELRPERRDELAALVRAGRVEIGPWYILPDEFLVSGESLVRNLQFGRRGARRFGEPLPVGYLPDPFGHVAQMPQLLQGFGIDTIVFSRGMGDEFGRLGSEFEWVAPDGNSSVVALVQSSPFTNGYCNGELLVAIRDPQDPRIAEVADALLGHLATWAGSNVLLVACGRDHETINPRLPEVARLLDGRYANADVSITGLGEVARRVGEWARARAGAGDPIGRHSGELRGSRHAPILANTFSARIPLKQDNALLQTWLERYVEPIVALAGATDTWHVPRAFLDQAWSLALQNQPHDSIGGCSVDAVHDEMPARTLRAFELCQGVLEQVTVALGHDQEPLAFNPHGEVFGGMVVRPGGEALWLDPVAALQLVPLADVQRPGGARAVDDRTIESDALRVHAGRDGRVRIALLDADGGEAAVVEDALRFVDEADAGDEYDFGLVAGDQPVQARLAHVHARVNEAGVAELELHHELELPAGLAADRDARSRERVPSDLVTVVRVAGDQPWADCVTEWVNIACDHRLRLHVAIPHPVDTTLADGHFHLVERPVVPPQPEVPWKQDPATISYCESVAAAVQPAGGVAVLGRGLHEYGVVTGSDGRQSLALTVLRSVGWLSRDDIVGRPGHAGPALETPGAQCIGEHAVEYAIAPLAAGTSREHVAMLGRRFGAPCFVIEPIDPEVVPHSGHEAWARDIIEARGAVATLDGFNAHGIALSGIELSAVKPAEDDSGDVVVRGFNTAAADVEAVLRVPPGWGARRARIDEQELAACEVRNGEVRESVAPGVIATWRLSPA